jgi:hypothetical protein
VQVERGMAKRMKAERMKEEGVIEGREKRRG